MSKFGESRFAHLLQPIRDLAENWNVDVASELEDYLNEIGNLEFAFDGQIEKFNFAEAALLIQGSACVYSKKVEFLYQLVYETLDLLASKRKLAQKSSVDENGKDFDAQDFAEDEESFLPLDDLKEDKNIDLIESGSIQRWKQKLTRTPMVLVPLQDCEKVGDSILVGQNGATFGNKSDFKMNSSVIHESGTLLLGVDEMQFLDDSFAVPNASTMNTLVVNDSKGGDLDAQVDDHGVDAMADFDDNDNDNDDDFIGEAEDHDDDDMEIQFGNAATTSDTNVPKNATVQMKLIDDTIVAKEQDVWQPLDAFSSGTSAMSNSFRRIKTYRIPSHLAKTTSTRHQKPPLCPISTFCSRVFSGVHHRNLPRGIRAPQYMEFAEYYSAEQRRRTMLQRQDKTAKEQNQPAKIPTAHASETSAAALYELDPLDLSAVPLNHDDDDNDHDDGSMFGDDGDDVEYDDIEPARMDDEFAQNASTEEPDFLAAHKEAAAVTYEDLVRQHIENYIADAQKYAVETDLTKRLQDWESRIKPALQQESKRKPFDIHAYGATVMDKFDPKETAGTGKPTPFADLLSGVESYEISRMFLAALQLANTGNVEISRKLDIKSKTPSMELKLLSRDMHHHQFKQMAPLLAA